MRRSALKGGMSGAPGKKPKRGGELWAEREASLL